MDINEKDVPEKMDDDLSKIAYNIVPDGAEYDVFSENVKKNEKGVLLFDDISSEKGKSKSKSETESFKADKASLPKPQSENENPEDKAENVGMEYDVFSENANPDAASKRETNREYLDRIFDGGIEIPEETIVMKRSDYISAYNRIEEDFRNAKKECLIDLLWVLIIVAFSTLLCNFLKYLQGNIMSIVFTNLLTMAVIACELASRIVCVFLIISLIKKNIKIKEARQKALERLEKRKEELMLMGLYDLSN